MNPAVLPWAARGLSSGVQDARGSGLEDFVVVRNRTTVLLPGGPDTHANFQAPNDSGWALPFGCTMRIRSSSAER